MKQEKLLALESLRGIAALSVAFFHLKIGSHFNNTFSDNAWLMVDFFFVLSGFVISLSYIDKIKDCRGLISFQKKRFLRLYPLHLIMLVAFIFLELAKLFADTVLGITIYEAAFSAPNDFFAIVTNFFLLHNWLSSDLNFNTPSWSISAEFITYAIFGCVVLMTGGKRQSVTFILIISMLVFGILLNEFGMGLETYTLFGPLRCLYSFSIGGIVFVIFEKFKNRFSFSTSIAAIALLITSVLVLILFGHTEFEYLVLIPLLFGALILVISMTNKNTLIIKILSVNWLVYLGTISYGIYMIHVFLWITLGIVLNRVFNIQHTASEDGKIRTLTDNVFLADGISILGISLVIILAHLSFKKIETRFIGKKSKN